MKTKVLCLSALIIIISLNCLAQENEKRLSVELSAGVSKAIAKLSDATLTGGLGSELIFHYRFMPHTGVYAGWGWNRFSADKSFAGNNMDFEETGYVLGLQFKHPVGNSPLSYYVRGGALYNHIEIENEEGIITNDTRHGWGGQLAAGADIPLNAKWSLTPGLKFNSLSRKIEMEGNSTKLDLHLSYISLRIGILKRF